MKNKRKIIALLAIILAPLRLPSQQEVVLRISEGMPMISVAVPKIILQSQTQLAKDAAAEIHSVLLADLKYSRIFQPLPEDYYGYVRPLNPEKIIFKDWDSVQAKLLFVGEVRENGGVVGFDGKIYDVRSERFIMGKRYQAAKADLRLAAHRIADEFMKLYGEKPIFTTRITFVSNRDGNDEIYMMDYDGANQTRITFNKIKDYMPAWSPDQRNVVFTSYRKGNADLYIRNIYEGKERLVSTKGTSYSGAFSPDGKKLAFCSTASEDGNAEIYVMDLAANRTKRLTFNPATDTAPSWSPTGREIAFTSDRTGAGAPQIFIMDAEGANIRKISFGGNYHDAPAWSPWGDQLVFVSRVDKIFDLYLLNIRTNQASKLTESNALNESPSWSPDGRHIVFSSSMSGSLQLYTIDYDARNLRRLTSLGQNKLPNWTN